MIGDPAFFICEVGFHDFANKGANRTCDFGFQIKEAPFGFITIFGTERTSLGAAARAAPYCVPCAPVELDSKFGHSNSLTTAAGIRINRPTLKAAS
jgi:hypothetical protein